MAHLNMLNRPGRNHVGPVDRLRQSAAARKGWRCEKRPTKAQARRYAEPFHFHDRQQAAITLGPPSISWGETGVGNVQVVNYYPSSWVINTDLTYTDAGSNTVWETPPPWQYVTNTYVPNTQNWQGQTALPSWAEVQALYGREMTGGSSPQLLWTPETVTPEEADRRLRETRARAAKFANERQRAVRKGRRLLLVTLSEVQQREYATTGSFLVQGANGKWYRCRKNGTTHELGLDGTATHSHCIHLSHSFIPEDTLIAVKLLLETDPEEFHRIANTTPLRQRPGCFEPRNPLMAVMDAMDTAVPIYALAA